MHIESTDLGEEDLARRKEFQIVDYSGHACTIKTLEVNFIDTKQINRNFKEDTYNEVRENKLVIDGGSWPVKLL